MDTDNVLILLNTALLVCHLVLQFYCKDDVMWASAKEKHKYRTFDMKLQYTRTCCCMF